MPYSKLLKKIIEDSGYSQKDIIEKCSKEGKNINKTYLSKLINGKTTPPSKEISSILAKVLNTNEKLLIIEGYLDKAPQEIRTAIINIKKLSIYQAIEFYKNKFAPEYIELLKEEIDNQPLSDFILEFIEQDKQTRILNEMEKLEMNIDQDQSKIQINFSQPHYFPVTDNAMFPIIPHNSQVLLKMEEKYVNGDIVAVKIKKIENILLRQLVYSNDNIILIPLNKEYSTTTYRKEDIMILGKAIKVINDI